MIFNEQDQRILKLLEKWYYDGRHAFIGRNQNTLEELGLSNSEYDNIMSFMEEIGVIEANHGFSHEPNHIALDFKILPNVAQMVKQLDFQLKESTRDKKNKWLNRVEKLIWVIVGCVITIIGLWIAKRLGIVE